MDHYEFQFNDSGDKWTFIFYNDDSIFIEVLTLLGEHKWTSAWIKDGIIFYRNIGNRNKDFVNKAARQFLERVMKLVVFI